MSMDECCPTAQNPDAALLGKDGDLNCSVLIIEDDATIRSFMETILQMEGYDVRSAGDGASGIDRIREKCPDLVLCDVMMPKIDGYAVLETLKRDVAFAGIPFIFVTSLNDRADLRRGMSRGADDYLTKPFLAEELVAAVSGRLHRSESFRLHAEKTFFQKEHAFLRQQITPRELEVLLYVGQGYTSKDIAKRLGICHNTVQVHRNNLMMKLDTPNAASLARWAVIAEQVLPTET